MPTQATVIYDPDCGFCRWSLAVLLSWDRGGSRWRGSKHGAIGPLPLGSVAANDLLAGLDPEERESSWHLVVAGDGPARFSAGAALAPALRLLPGGRVPASVFAHFPRATERGYRWVADHRGRLGRFIPARARRWADRVITAHGSPSTAQ